VSEVPGFRFTEAQAKDLVVMLQQCADLLNKSAAYAIESCEHDAAHPFTQHIARILTDLGWDVLEQGFYKKYPNLRPLESSLRNQ
jgi:hypothetical protein